LWRNTVESATTPGSIVSQVEAALQQLPPAQVIKLYNSGSFFDLGAVPIADRMRIAGMLSGFEKMIVECHPRLMQNAAIDFAARIEGTLEIAFGLETAHPEALEKLNKRINRENYFEAVRRCKSSGIEVRTFLLVNPPFVPAPQQREWLEKSVQFAFDAGSDVVSLIPTRGGNGALEELQAYGEFSEPGLADVENGLEFALALNRGIAFADTWDLKRFSGCEFCFLPRAERIQRMNISQQIEPEPICGQCGAGS